MIKYLLLTLENILECIGQSDPKVLKKIREGASLSDLNEEFNLGLPLWQSRMSPLLAKYVNDKDLINENQRLQKLIQELELKLENQNFNSEEKIAYLRRQLNKCKK